MADMNTGEIMAMVLGSGVVSTLVNILSNRQTQKILNRKTDAEAGLEVAKTYQAMIEDYRKERVFTQDEIKRMQHQISELQTQLAATMQNSFIMLADNGKLRDRLDAITKENQELLRKYEEALKK